MKNNKIITHSLSHKPSLKSTAILHTYTQITKTKLIQTKKIFKKESYILNSPPFSTTHSPPSSKPPPHFPPNISLTLSAFSSAFFLHCPHHSFFFSILIFDPIHGRDIPRLILADPDQQCWRSW